MEIITNAKRSKGKHNKCLTVREMYKDFKETELGKNIPYKVFKGVIDDHNKKYMYKTIELSETVKLPYRFGSVDIKKYKRNLHDLPMNRWPIDYKESKELGLISFITEDYGYKFNWHRDKAIVKNKMYYYFIPTRTNKRWLADAIKNRKRDYFG